MKLWRPENFRIQCKKKKWRIEVYSISFSWDLFRSVKRLFTKEVMELEAHFKTITQTAGDMSRAPLETVEQHLKSHQSHCQEDMPPFLQLWKVNKTP